MKPHKGSEMGGRESAGGFAGCEVTLRELPWTVKSLEEPQGRTLRTGLSVQFGFERIFLAAMQGGDPTKTEPGRPRGPPRR